MPVRSLLCRSSLLTLLAFASASQAQDLHLKKNISSGGYVVSTTETSIKGARERSVTQSPNGSTMTLRQCDLRRTGDRGRGESGDGEDVLTPLLQQATTTVLTPVSTKK